MATRTLTRRELSTAVHNQQKINGVAEVLSEVRSQLEAIVHTEQELTESLPACVLLGGITACRELLAALLGENSVATTAAEYLISPGIRQPLALELRCGSQAFGSIHDPEAQAWLQNVAQAATHALGNRLNVEPLRLRLSSVGCANIDIVYLPDCQGLGNSPKIDEMRVRHLGSSANLLVCLEPSVGLELCRRFDPTLQRTLLFGEHSRLLGRVREQRPSELASVRKARAGPDGEGRPGRMTRARLLEEQFAVLCNERQQQWLSSLERLKARLTQVIW